VGPVDTVRDARRFVYHGGMSSRRAIPFRRDPSARPADAEAAPTLWSLGVQLVRDYWRFAGRKGVMAVVFVGLGAVLEGAGLVLLIPILAVAIRTGAKNNWALKAAFQAFDAVGLHSRFQRLSFLLASFALLMILRALVISVRDVTLARLQVGFVESQRAMITRRLAQARWEVVSRLRHARITHLMGGDIQKIGAASSTLVQSGISIVMLTSQCVLAFALSPLLATFTVVVLAIGAVTMAPVLRRAFALGTYVTGANLKLMNTTVQFLNGLKLAVSQDLQDSFVAEFEETLNSVTARQIEITRRQTNRRLVLSTLSAFVGALVVLVGFGFMNVEPAVLMTVLFVLARINGPATQLQQGAQTFVQCLPAYHKVKELESELAQAASNDVPAAGADRRPLEGPIVFRGVGFRHADVDDETLSAATLRDLDLTIEPGVFLGVTGPSGAGKTTFADLLAGLFAPRSGQIRVGGVPLRGAALGAWRRQISYVSQDPFLFHDTIRRNLLWGAPSSTEEELWGALRLAGADGLVRRMELGLETVVGERGALVSGGERQRLAMARAVLRKPRLLILDEATNAIDIAGERELFARLSGLKPRPTVVVIAHRIESLSLCDRVLVLEDGCFASAAAA
jgi:ABC-type multidrug transport system fused ATPase/permease subunit